MEEQLVSKKKKKRVNRLWITLKCLAGSSKTNEILAVVPNVSQSSVFTGEHIQLQHGESPRKYYPLPKKALAFEFSQ